MKISRLDAARTQLRTACRLYFESLDPISTHALASSAHDIVVNLKSKDPKMPKAIREMIIDRLANGDTAKQKEVWKNIHQARDFFKHAGTMRESIDFDPQSTEVVLFDACRFFLHTAKSDLPMEGMIFVMWFAIQHSNWFSDTYMQENIKVMHREVGHLDRRDFFHGIIEHWNSDAVRKMVDAVTGAPGRRASPSP